MKKIFFAALAAAVMFASCSKENNEAVTAIGGDPAKITVQFTNVGNADARALDQLSG